jgi:hypothetical protein
MSYATLAEFKSYLQIATAITTDDVLLQDFLDEASAILRDFVGFPLDAATNTTRYFDAVADVRDGRLLTFDGYYAVSISSVVNGDGETISASDYVTEPRNGVPFYGIRLKLESDQIFTFDDSPENAIAVTGKWCYSENADGSADDLTRGATLQLAAYLYRAKDNVADLNKVVQTVDGVTIVSSALPAGTLARLGGRRRLV